MNEREDFTGLQVRGYQGANWFTKRGVREKRRLIEKKGLPDMRRCLFITLTIPEGVREPWTAYETGKKRLPQFLRAFRKAIGRSFAWAWKLEFQENGMPHWHLIVDFRERIPQDFLYLFEKWWSLGRVNVKRLKRDEFAYLFKYVSKAADGDADPETGIGLPAWVLDYQKKLKDGRTKAGLRFWQTGGGFYTKAKSATEKPATSPAEKPAAREPRFSRVPLTIRQRWALWMRKGTLFVKDREGQYRFSRQVYFTQPFREVLLRVAQATMNGSAAAARGCLGFNCRPSTIEKLLCQNHQTDYRRACLFRPGTVFFSAEL
jgi:hypothetical protein